MALPRVFYLHFKKLHLIGKVKRYLFVMICLRMSTIPRTHVLWGTFCLVLYLIPVL